MDYKKLAQLRLENHPFAKFLGLSIDEISEGRAVCSLEVKDHMRNPIGSVHGGVLYALGDNAEGSAVISYGGGRITTVEGSMHFLRAALETTTKLVARAEVIKKGRRLSTVHVQVFDQDDRLLDDGTFTLIDLDA